MTIPITAMKFISKDFYEIDNLVRIMTKIEKNGKLKQKHYGDSIIDGKKNEVLSISYDLKELRNKLKSTNKVKREELLADIADKKEELANKKIEYLSSKSDYIRKGKADCKINSLIIKSKKAFSVGNIEAEIICQIIKQELRKSYKLSPANRDVIVEQMIALLDNPMPKIIIRGDIKHFFESIPQEKLLQKLQNDGFVSRRSIKYLRGILYKCNEMNGNQMLGVPRGLAFSSYLSELYMKPVDVQIRDIDGVYFYKRYVDDIIIVADPAKGDAADYWKIISTLIESVDLELHTYSEKKYLEEWNSNTLSESFNYLGYCFTFTNGKLSVLMTDKRYNKYQILIDALFEIYSKRANYRTGKQNKSGTRKMKKDAIRQLFERLAVLTSNGYLSGRKNYVASGIYYSNKFLTNLDQLSKLDRYLSQIIDDRDSFCPPSNLFNYSEDNGYQENIEQIKKRLHSFSFVEGYKTKSMYKNRYFNRVMMELQDIYYSKTK